MMTEEKYVALGREFSAEAGVLNTLHGYFRQQVPRLHRTCQLFGLYEQPLGDVLEVGPFYSYTPLVLRSQAATYTVLEGDDPAAHPLKPLYAKHRVNADFLDLFEMFGPTHSAPHVLPYPDNAFDTVLCWETMEHFNFSPVKFVRDLLRVLKPGGRACITVPNRASLQGLAGLVLGRGERAHIEAFFQYEDYVSNGKKAFYGFHWHEYTVTEVSALFQLAGFEQKHCGTMVAFQAHEGTSLSRKVVRSANRVVAGLLPRFGTHVVFEGLAPARQSGLPADETGVRPKQAPPR